MSFLFYPVGRFSDVELVIHSLNKYLLSDCDVPGTALDSGKTTGDRRAKTPALLKLEFYLGRQVINNKIKYSTSHKCSGEKQGRAGG